MTSSSRRAFLRTTGATGLAVALSDAADALFTAASAGPQPPAGYGPLRSDPGGLLDLPPGFRYRVLSRTGSPWSPGSGFRAASTAWRRSPTGSARYDWSATTRTAWAHGIRCRPRPSTPTTRRPPEARRRSLSIAPERFGPSGSALVAPR
jgi:hypothetical protein